jgi:hypothetical protein
VDAARRSWVLLDRDERPLAAELGGRTTLRASRERSGEVTRGLDGRIVACARGAGGLRVRVDQAGAPIERDWDARGVGPGHEAVAIGARWAELGGVD